MDAINLSFSSHYGVMAAYGQHFAKTQELDPRFHRALLSAFSQRQLGDYQPISGLQPEDIEVMMKDAKDFLAASQEWLERS